MLKQDMSKYSIITLDKVSSTNSYALENISNLADRTVIYTPHQTSGRGRYNRVWVSDDSENIYVSFVLKPEEIDNFPFVNLTQYLSIILCRFLENEFSLTPSIKWPNDILIDGYKISGILAESFMQKNELKGVVLGLGLNVNLKKETIEKIDQKAVSLFTLTGCKYAPKVLLEKICNMFFKDYDAFITKIARHFCLWAEMYDYKMLVKVLAAFDYQTFREMLDKWSAALDEYCNNTLSVKERAKFMRLQYLLTVITEMFDSLTNKNQE